MRFARFSFASPMDFSTETPAPWPTNTLSAQDNDAFMKDPPPMGTKNEAPSFSCSIPSNVSLAVLNSLSAALTMLTLF